nr:MAG TPA: hypothetical protein [Caudoviricetes sp.]
MIYQLKRKTTYSLAYLLPVLGVGRYREYAVTNLPQ